MNEEIESMREQISTAKTTYKSLGVSLSALQTTLTTGDLRESVHEFELARKELLNRLIPLRSGNVSLVSVEEKEHVNQAWRRAHRTAMVRKMIFEDFWGMLCENLPEGVGKYDLWVSKGLACWSQSTGR